MGITAVIRVFDATASDAFLARANLRRTGRRRDPLDAALSGAVSRGRFVLWSNGRQSRLVDEAMIDAFARTCDVLSLSVNETVMASSVCMMSAGRRLWSVFHDAQQDAAHLDCFGTPPPQWQTFREDRQSQAVADPEGGVDYLYEVPCDLFADLTGLRPDAETGLDLEELEFMRPPRRPFWRFWA